MITRAELRKNKFIIWFFKKQEISEDMPFMEQVWRYQWNNKATIMIECGLLYIFLSWLKNTGVI